MLSDALRGALVGAGVGSALCVASGIMKRRQQHASMVGEDVGVKCTWLQADPQLSEMVFRYKEISEYGPDLYKALVEHCERLLYHVHNDSKTTRQIHANRALVAAKSTATALCKMASLHGSTRASELQRDVDELVALCNNHLHNVMMA